MTLPEACQHERTNLRPIAGRHEAEATCIDCGDKRTVPLPDLGFAPSPGLPPTVIDEVTDISEEQYAGLVQALLRPSKP